MGLRVGERQGRTPRAAEHLPFVDFGDLVSQLLDVLDQIPGRVRFQARIRRRFATAALVEDEDLVFVRIELPPVVGARTAARTAVEEHHRLAVRVAGQLPVEAMAPANVEMTALVRLDLGIERAAKSRIGWPQGVTASSASRGTSCRSLSRSPMLQCLTSSHAASSASLS